MVGLNPRRHPRVCKVLEMEEYSCWIDVEVTIDINGLE